MNKGRNIVCCQTKEKTFFFFGLATDYIPAFANEYTVQEYFQHLFRRNQLNLIRLTEIPGTLLARVNTYVTNNTLNKSSKKSHFQLTHHSK